MNINIDFILRFYLLISLTAGLFNTEILQAWFLKSLYPITEKKSEIIFGHIINIWINWLHAFIDNVHV